MSALPKSNRCGLRPLLVALLTLALSACGGTPSSSFDTTGLQEGGSGSSSDAGSGSDSETNSGYDATTPEADALASPDPLADVNLPDVEILTFDGDLVSEPGTCLAGHYSGNFLGIFDSSFTLFGSSTPVVGNIELTLDETNTGEFYAISNGTVSGTADLQYPYVCDLIGTLDCKTKQIENGALRNCVYCLGTLNDAGVCSGLEGHFNGPLTAGYDTSNHTFVNGGWAGSEEVDANAPPDAGGGCPTGPPNGFGGCGAWSAQYGGP